MVFCPPLQRGLIVDILFVLSLSLFSLTLSASLGNFLPLEFNVFEAAPKQLFIPFLTQQLRGTKTARIQMQTQHHSNAREAELKYAVFERGV